MEKPKTMRPSDRSEIRRQVNNAIIAGRTLPYELRTMIEAGIPTAKIIKVYRQPELRRRNTMFKDNTWRCDHCGARGPLVEVEGLEVCELCARTMLESARDEMNPLLTEIRR